jgi:hypothetical protein
VKYWFDVRFLIVIIVITNIILNNDFKCTLTTVRTITLLSIIYIYLFIASGFFTLRQVLLDALFVRIVLYVAIYRPVHLCRVILVSIGRYHRKHLPAISYINSQSLSSVDLVEQIANRKPFVILYVR